MIANSRNILNQGTQNASDKDVNEGYIGFTMMQTDKTLKAIDCRGYSGERTATRNISGNIGTTGDEQIPGVVRN